MLNLVFCFRSISNENLEQFVLNNQYLVIDMKIKLVLFDCEEKKNLKVNNML